MSSDAPQVMVVDDDEDIRETVGMVLAASGYTAVPAVDGADALELLGDEGTRPSLILLDLRMPRLSGEQVMQQLEQLRAQVSGVSMDEEAANLVRFQRAYEANARYFTTVNDLLDTLMGMVQ